MMEYRKCNPLYGYRWFSEGAKLFFSQPWPWLAMVGITLLFLLVLSILPLFGIIGIYVLFPGIAAGFMLACRDAMAREAIGFRHLVAGFKTAAHPLLAVGGMAFLIFILSMLLILLGWREEFQRLLELMQSKTPDKDVMLSAAQQLTLPSLMVLGVMLLLAIATWFAPALVLFRQVPARLAMRISFRACLANFFPFLVFCALLLVLDIALSFGLRLLLSGVLSVGGEQIANAAAMLLTFPIVCGFLATIFGAAYVSYMDVFESQSSA